MSQNLSSAAVMIGTLRVNVFWVSVLESDKDMKGLMGALRFYARKSTSSSQAVSLVRFNNFLSAYTNSRCLATCSKVLKERQYRPRRAVLYVAGNDDTNSRCLATCSKIVKERQYRPRRAVLYVPGNDDTNSRCLATCSKVLKERQYRPRRAVLYVPGNDERKLQKISSLNVDCAVMDCEDGVAINRKVGLNIFYSN